MECVPRQSSGDPSDSNYQECCDNAVNEKAKIYISTIISTENLDYLL